MRRHVSSREKVEPPRWRVTSTSPRIAAWASRSSSRKPRRRRRVVWIVGTAREISLMEVRPGRRCGRPRGSLLAEREAAEALVEARDLAALVEHPAMAAGPGGMYLRIDVELQRVAFLAPGGAGLEHGAV